MAGLAAANIDPAQTKADLWPEYKLAATSRCFKTPALLNEGDRFKGQRVGIIVTGGNVDIQKYAALLSEAS